MSKHFLPLIEPYFESISKDPRIDFDSRITMNWNKYIESEYKHMQKASAEDWERIKSCGPIKWPQSFPHYMYVGSGMNLSSIANMQAHECFLEEDRAGNPVKCFFRGSVLVKVSENGTLIFPSWRSMVD